MGRRVRTPQPLSLVRNSWKRAVKPCCTTRLWQVILLHEHAWLHSNNIGGSAKHNKVTKNSLKCILSKNSLSQWSDYSMSNLHTISSNSKLSPSLSWVLPITMQTKLFAHSLNFCYEGLSYIWAKKRVVQLSQEFTL